MPTTVLTLRDLRVAFGINKRRVTNKQRFLLYFKF